MVAEWPLDHAQSHAQRQNYSNVSLLFSTRKTSDVGPFLVVNTATIVHPYSRLYGCASLAAANLSSANPGWELKVFPKR